MITTAAAIPIWSPNKLEAALFRWRDNILWSKIKHAIDKYELSEFDIVHYDSGLDFTRDGRFAKQITNHNRKVVCFYHGSDLRNRGIIPAVDNVASLRLTCEWDLLEMDPRLRYLYLPFDMSSFPDRHYAFHKPIRICHASRNPYKGTAYLKKAVRTLSRKHSIELIVMKNVPHHEAIAIINSCDIFVDQLTNAGGWGYGMSSVEALAMAMPVITNIPQQMLLKIGEHPFVQATPHTICDVLDRLICNEKTCSELAAIGRHWVKQRHDVRAVGDQLYAYYREAGCIPTT